MNYFSIMAKHTKDESALHYANSVHLVRQKSANMNEVCAISYKSLILIMLYVVLDAVLHFAGYILSLIHI